MVKKAQLGCQEIEASRVSLVTLAPRVRKGPEDPRALQVLQAHRVSLDLKG